MNSTRIELIYHELDHSELQRFQYFKNIISKTNSDTILVTANGEEIKAHQIVLSSLSGRLGEALRQVQCGDSRPKLEPYRLLVKKVGSKALKLVLAFMYNSGVRMLASEYFEFREAAKYLHVNGFVEEAIITSPQFWHFQPLELRMTVVLDGQEFPNEACLSPKAKEEDEIADQDQSDDSQDSEELTDCEDEDHGVNVEVEEQTPMDEGYKSAEFNPLIGAFDDELSYESSLTESSSNESDAEDEN